jgi:hypothetical protein
LNVSRMTLSKPRPVKSEISGSVRSCSASTASTQQGKTVVSEAVAAKLALQRDYGMHTDARLHWMMSAHLERLNVT